MNVYSYVVSVPATIHTKGDTSIPFTDELINTVCSLMDITNSEIYEKSRRPRLVMARYMVWEIMLAFKGFSLKDAGAIFGEYDHTTVLHGIDRLPLDLHQNEYLNLIYNEVLRQMKLTMEPIEKFRLKREKFKADRKSRMAQIF